MSKQAGSAAGRAGQRREQKQPGSPARMAERAGASPPPVIYYFKTRDQLLTGAAGGGPWC
jgi:hypothetical protein